MDTQIFSELFAEFQNKVHEDAKKKGLWPELEGVNIDEPNEHGAATDKINVGEKLALIFAKISNALEAERKPFHENDKHYPQFSEIGIKLADAVIMIMDLSEALGLPLAGAILTKVKHNQSRPHKYGKRF